MSLPKIEELKELSHEDIERKITELKKDLFDIRFKQATKQSIKPHIFKHKKHELAQLLMLEKIIQSTNNKKKRCLENKIQE